MNKFSLKEVFRIYGGNSGLTEKLIYENQAKNPEDNIYVFSGATEERFHLPRVDKNLQINNKPIKYFSKDYDYILVVRKGKAGCLQLIQDMNFAINDDAYILKVKKYFIDKVNLEYFVMKYQKDFLNFVSSKDSNGTFSKEIAENYEIELEDIDIQNEYINAFIKKRTVLNKIVDQKKKIEDQMKQTIKTSNNKKFLMFELFKISSGVRITQKEVYHNNGDFPVVTSKTTSEGIAWYANKEWLSTFTKNNKPVIVENECLTWSKDGNAGKLFFRDYPFYQNDHSGALVPKKGVKINLHWFKFYFQNEVYKHVVAKNSQGMLYEEQMANIEVEIPVAENGEIDIDIQEIIYTEYKRLSDIKGKLQSIIDKYSSW